MPEKFDAKIKTTVTMTARQVNAINGEVRRTGLAFNEVVRRWLDRVIDLDLVNVDVIDLPTLVEGAIRRSAQIRDRRSG
jgi:hypothetical protein